MDFSRGPPYEFDEWIKRHREAKGWALEVLARQLDKLGYPVSPNKLWRIENAAKYGLHKIDLEFKLWLEALFEERYESQYHDVVSIDEVLALIGGLFHCHRMIKS